MGGPRILSTYLDTHIAGWIAEGNLKKLSAAARESLRHSQLLISPMVALELEFLYEIGRIRLRGNQIQAKLSAELGVRICDLPFASISYQALQEGWTRDPFDRIIVAQARANARAPLISADSHIAGNYPGTIW